MRELVCWSKAGLFQLIFDASGVSNHISSVRYLSLTVHRYRVQTPHRQTRGNEYLFKDHRGENAYVDHLQMKGDENIKEEELLPPQTQ